MTSRYLDLLERTVWTALQAALAVWLVTPNDLFSDTALKVAGTAAAIAAAKCLLAFGVGSPNTAATLPAGPDTDAGGTSEAPAEATPVPSQRRPRPARTRRSS